MRGSRYWTLLLMSVVLILGLVAVTTMAEPAPQDQQTLRFPSVVPETMDPALAVTVPDQTLVINLFEGLTRLGQGDLPVPGVAESWIVSPDGLTYTFTLRESRWSNGDPVTAGDFEAAWKRVLAPKTGSEYAYQLYPLRNAREYNSGKLKDASQLGVRALDDRHLEVILYEPTPYFLTLTAFPTLMPVHRIATEKKNWTAKPETFVTNGPFQLSGRTDRTIELVKNPTYWDAANIKLERLIQVNEPSPEKEAALYEAGELDLLDNFPAESYERWQSEAGFQNQPYLGTYFFYVNTRKAQLKDKRVRQAIFLGLDRVRMAGTIGKNQVPAAAFVPPGVPELAVGTDFRTTGGDFLASGNREQDLARAAELLTAAGYPNGKGLKLELLYNTYPSHTRVAEIVKESLKADLGIDVKLVSQEWKTYLQTMDKGKFDLARNGWIADYVHPLSFLDLLTTSSPNNKAGWSNADYDALVSRARSTQDPAESIAAMHQAEAILMDEVPVMPVYFYGNPVVYRAWAKDVHLSALGLWDFRNAWVEAH